MTVSYTKDLATSGIYGTLPALLRWRGSLYKAVFPWILIYIAIFYTIALVYEYAFDEGKQLYFARIAAHTTVVVDNIPIVFMLGFYVKMCVTRWWSCYTALPDTNMAIVVAHYVFRANDTDSKQKCRDFCRYIKTLWVMYLKEVASDLQKMYPDNESFVTHGFLTNSEVEALNGKGPKRTTSLISVWASDVVRHSNLNDIERRLLENHREGVERTCAKIICDLLTIPLLVGSLICHLTVHAYGILSLISMQYSNPNFNNVKPTLAVFDFYLPIFSFLLYMFFYGWLRVGLITLNPFGNDDNDISMVNVAEQNFKVADTIEQYFDHPELLDVDKILFDEAGSVRPYFHKLAVNIEP